MMQMIAGDGDTWIVGNDDTERPMYCASRRLSWEPPYMGSIYADARPEDNGWCVSAGKFDLHRIAEGLAEADAVQIAWNLTTGTLHTYNR